MMKRATHKKMQITVQSYSLCGNAAAPMWYSLRPPQDKITTPFPWRKPLLSWEVNLCPWPSEGGSDPGKELGFSHRTNLFPGVICPSSLPFYLHVPPTPWLVPSLHNHTWGGEHLATSSIGQPVHSSLTKENKHWKHLEGIYHQWNGDTEQVTRHLPKQQVIRKQDWASEWSFILLDSCRYN